MWTLFWVLFDCDCDCDCDVNMLRQQVEALEMGDGRVKSWLLSRVVRDGRTASAKARSWCYKLKF